MLRQSLLVIGAGLRGDAVLNFCQLSSQSCFLFRSRGLVPRPDGSKLSIGQGPGAHGVVLRRRANLQHVLHIRQGNRGPRGVKLQVEVLRPHLDEARPPLVGAALGNGPAAAAAADLVLPRVQFNAKLCALALGKRRHGTGGGRARQRAGQRVTEKCCGQ